MRLAALEAPEGDLYIHQWTELAAGDLLGQAVEWVELPDARGPDAILFMSTYAQPADSWLSMGVPMAEIRVLENGEDDRPAPPGVDVLRTSIAEEPEAVRAIGAWLRANDVGQHLTGPERQMIEVIVQEVTAAMATNRFEREDPEELAQLQAALDTAAAQLRAPRSSRSVVGWAMGQIPGFVLGMLSSTASNYLTLLIA